MVAETARVRGLLSVAEALQAQAGKAYPDGRVLRRHVPRLVDRLHLLRDLLEDMRDFAQVTPCERTPELLAGLVGEALHLVQGAGLVRRSSVRSGSTSWAWPSAAMPTAASCAASSTA